MRIGDYRNDAQKQNSMFADGLEVLAHTNEVLIPGGFRSGVFPRTRLQKGVTPRAESQEPNRAARWFRFGSRRAKDTRMAGSQATSKKDDALRTTRPLGEIMKDPRLLEQSKLLAEQITSLTADPKLEELYEFVTETRASFKANRYIQEHAKFAVEHLSAIMHETNLWQQQLETLTAPSVKGQDLQERAAVFSDQAKAMMELPGLQKHSTLFAEHIKLIMEHPEVQERAKLASEGLKAITEDQDFVRRIELASEQSSLFLRSLLSDLEVKHRAATGQLDASLKYLAKQGSRSTSATRLAPVRMQAEQEATPPPPPPLPKIKTMRVGDGTLAGDLNFDPLEISNTPGALAWYREAEIKHARLAMLAALGWPVSELTNFGNLLTSGGRAPSLLNGGLENVNAVYWAAVIALAAYWEGRTFDKMFGKQDDYLPGMLGFDPLGGDSQSTRNAEILNGRVAMVAITLYAFEEAITKAPIFPINLFSPFTGIGAGVSSAVGDAVGAGVGAAPELLQMPETQQLEEMAANRGDAVGAAAAAAGEAIGAGVGAAVDAVGDAVGSGVGDAVGAAVDAVGSGVIDAVGAGFP